MLQLSTGLVSRDLLIRRNLHGTPRPAQILADLRRLAQRLASAITVERPCKAKIRPTAQQAALSAWELDCAPRMPATTRVAAHYPSRRVRGCLFTPPLPRAGTQRPPRAMVPDRAITSSGLRAGQASPNLHTNYLLPPYHLHRKMPVMSVNRDGGPASPVLGEGDSNACAADR